MANSNGDGEILFGEIFAVSGIVITLSSIPYFISSGKNKRKAATVSFNNQKIVLPQIGGFIVKTQPAITLEIGIE